MAGRFVSDRDNLIIDQFNKELIEDVIGQTCTIYKINAYNTKTNIYGESVGGGKNYNVGVQLPCIITASDIDWNYAYFEINSINENKLLGGDAEKNHDLEAICHMTRRSKLNLEQRVK